MSSRNPSPETSIWKSLVAVAVLAIACSDSGPNGPAHISIVAGGAPQTAIAGAAVPVAPSVMVTDHDNAPIATVRVTFAVTGGGGTVIPTTIMTDASGIATTSGWVLGPTLGANQLTATVQGLPSVTFSATATAGLPSSVTAEAGTTAQTATVGTSVPVPPSVLVKDALGNPVSGVTVQFVGAGLANPSSVITDANGRARVTSWTLGTTAGPQTLVARVPGLLATVQFNATALAGPPANLNVSPPSFTFAMGGTGQITASVRDVYGNLPTNAPLITFGSSNTGVATVTSGGFVTAAGLGSANITVTAGTLTKSVSVSVLARVAIAGRPFGVGILTGGTAFITQQDAALVTRVDVVALTAGASISTGGNPSDVAIDPAGAFGYTPNVTGGSVSVLNLSANSLVTNITFSGQPFRTLVSPDGQLVYASNNNGQIAVIQASTRTIVRTYTLGQLIPLNGLAQTSDGQTLYASSMLGTVYRLKASDGSVLGSRQVGGTAQEVLLSPDGADLYVANEAGYVDVLDATTLSPKQHVNVEAAFAMAISPDGTQLWVSASNAGKVFALTRATLAI